MGHLTEGLLTLHNLMGDAGKNESKTKKKTKTKNRSPRGTDEHNNPVALLLTLWGGVLTQRMRI